MDFLLTPRYRLPYILVFAVLANELFTELGSIGGLNFFENTYLRIIYKICKSVCLLGSL